MSSWIMTPLTTHSRKCKFSTMGRGEDGLKKCRRGQRSPSLKKRFLVVAERGGLLLYGKEQKDATRAEICQGGAGGWENLAIWPLGLWLNSSRFSAASFLLPFLFVLSELSRRELRVVRFISLLISRRRRCSQYAEWKWTRVVSLCLFLYMIPDACSIEREGKGAIVAHAEGTRERSNPLSLSQCLFFRSLARSLVDSVVF